MEIVGTGPESTPQRPQRAARPRLKRPNWGAGALVFLVDGVCAAVVGAYLASGSIEVTVIVAAVAVVVVGLVVLVSRR